MLDDALAALDVLRDLVANLDEDEKDVVLMEVQDFLDVECDLVLDRTSISE